MSTEKTENEKALHYESKDIEFDEKHLIASHQSQKEEHHNQIEPEFDLKSNVLVKQLKDIQAYMIERVKKAGVNGLAMSELENVVRRKFITDLVAMCPGLVTFERGASNVKKERVVVTDLYAPKMKLKSKLQLVITEHFKKGEWCFLFNTIYLC